MGLSCCYRREITRAVRQFVNGRRGRENDEGSPLGIVAMDGWIGTMNGLELCRKSLLHVYDVPMFKHIQRKNWKMMIHVIFSSQDSFLPNVLVLLAH